MSKSVLITRPNHDLLTNLLAHWSEVVILEAGKRQFEVIDLLGRKATRKILHSYLRKQKPSLVFLNGHGSADLITGYDNEILIDGQNEEDRKLLRGLIIYARSCDAGRKLGESIIDDGAKTFLGYKRKYTVVHSTERVSKPLKDDLAKMFIEPSNLIPTSLLKGNTTGHSFKKSQENMRRNFRKMLSSQATSDQQYAAPFLWSNIKSQVLLGDATALLY